MGYFPTRMLVRPGYPDLLRQVTVLLAVLAISARGLVPAGWMPNPAGIDLGIPLVVCTVHGLRTVYLDEAGRPLPSDKLPTDHAANSCPMAVLGALAPPPEVALLASPVPLWLPPADLQGGATIAATPAPVPPARGPPAVA